MDTILCLCKGIKKYEIIDTIIKGAHTVDDIKEKLGVTSGLCGGERCKTSIEYFIEQYKDCKPSQEEYVYNQMDTLVCFCKQIKKSDIIDAINDGYDTVDKLKEKLNVTNGICIGERCRENIEEIIKIHLKK